MVNGGNFGLSQQESIEKSQNFDLEMAPWPDFRGQDIFSGSKILHSSGEIGIVEFDSTRRLLVDQWLVNYGDGVLSRLCLQIGDKGQAVVVNERED